jgi:hypothetical protein
MAGDVVIRAVRPFMHAGRAIAAGETLRLSALQAGECIATGRAELAHAGDAEAVRAAERAELDRTLRTLGRRRIEPAPEGWPWQLWRGA